MKKTVTILWESGDEYSYFETGKETNYSGSKRTVSDIRTYDNVVEIKYTNDSKSKISGVPFCYDEYIEKQIIVE